MSSAKGRKVGTLGTQARHKRHRAGCHARSRSGCTELHPSRRAGPPRAAAAAAQQEIHVHHRWHGVTAEDVSAILARVNHDGRGRVD